MLRALLNLVRALDEHNAFLALKSLGKLRSTTGGLRLVDSLGPAISGLEEKVEKGDFQRALRDLGKLVVRLQEALGARTGCEAEDVVAFYEAALSLRQGDIEAFRRAVRKMALEIRKRFGGLWSLAPHIEWLMGGEEDADRLTRALEAFASYYSHILANHVRMGGRSLYLIVSSIF
ncbi:hypothetical protein DRO32_02110 [Candidatus Bathyarchaeota archaeon]|nr:MAG: hypothetical protein DRO32_02110 [Candidatus Bathyarchaeota archaeon]